MQAVEQRALPIRLFTVREFERMLAAGVFSEDEKLELSFGRLVHGGEPTQRDVRRRLARGELPVRRISIREFRKMVDANVFDPDERLELLEGEIVRMTPQTDSHARSIMLCQEVLARAFGKGFFVRVQMPLEFPQQASRPEPDIAIAKGGPREWARVMLSTATLVVEVAFSTLRRDRDKARIYAGAGIEDFWIVNLRSNVLEVHREPLGAGRRAHYESIQVLGPRESIAPLRAPRRKVRVKDLLP